MREKYFENWARVCYLDTLWVKNFVEIALSCTIFDISAILSFASLAKKCENSKWPPFLVREKYFVSWAVYVACRNRSIWHGFKDTRISKL